MEKIVMAGSESSSGQEQIMRRGVVEAIISARCVVTALAQKTRNAMYQAEEEAYLAALRLLGKQINESTQYIDKNCT